MDTSQKIQRFVRAGGGFAPAATYRIMNHVKGWAVVNDYSGMIVSLHGCRHEAIKRAEFLVTADYIRADIARVN